MTKKLISGLILAPIFFREFYLNWMLGIVANYYYMQFQGKITNQTWENGKKLHSGLPEIRKLGLPNFKEN